MNDEAQKKVAEDMTSGIANLVEAQLPSVRVASTTLSLPKEVTESVPKAPTSEEKMNRPLECTSASNAEAAMGVNADTVRKPTGSVKVSLSPSPKAVSISPSGVPVTASRVVDESVTVSATSIVVTKLSSIGNASANSTSTNTVASPVPKVLAVAAKTTLTTQSTSETVQLVVSSASCLTSKPNVLSSKGNASQCAAKVSSPVRSMSVTHVCDGNESTATASVSAVKVAPPGPSALIAAVAGVASMAPSAYVISATVRSAVAATSTPLTLFTEKDIKSADDTATDKSISVEDDARAACSAIEAMPTPEVLAAPESMDVDKAGVHLEETSQEEKAQADSSTKSVSEQSTYDATAEDGNTASAGDKT